MALKLSHLLIMRLVCAQIASIFFMMGAVIALVRLSSDHTVLIFYFLCACFFVFSSLLEIPIYALDERYVITSNRISV